MRRTFALALTIVTAGGVSAADKPAPVAAKTVTLKSAGTLADTLAEVTKQTGIAFDLTAADGTAKVNANFNNATGWAAIEAVADQAGCFVGVSGDKVRLGKRPKGVAAVPSGIDGPFRVVLKKVIARRDPELPDAEYELHLEVQWEPRFPVYLIDTEPKATATAGQQKLTANAASVRVIPTGHSHPAVVRLKNVPREAKQLDELTGTFRVVAAAKMLAVEFADLTGDKPVSQAVEGVTVTLHPVKKTAKRAEFRVDLEYPQSHPEFESFQQWSGTNQFRLYPPADRAGLPPTDYSASESGRRVRSDYSYAGPNGAAFNLPDLKGWRVVYQTPCPMAEQEVKFTLKAVVLP